MNLGRHFVLPQAIMRSRPWCFSDIFCGVLLITLIYTRCRGILDLA